MIQMIIRDVGHILNGWARTRMWSIAYSTLVTIIGTLLMRYLLGYSLLALPDLKTSDPDTSFNKTLHQDIFSALIPIGGLTGAALAGWLVDLLGRKLVLVFFMKLTVKFIIIRA